MAAPTRPGNAERGWNDPPVFLHTPAVGSPPESLTQVAAPRRNLLNKRVAHPGIFSGGGTSYQPSDGNKPPPLGVAPVVDVPVVNALPVCPSLPPNDTTPQAVPIPPVQATNPALPPSVSGVILLPPAMSTDIPRFTAPIIVPTMSPSDESPISNLLVAKNPVTNQPVNTEAGGRDISIPDFDNDEQLFHFVLTRLRKTCISCEELNKPRVIEEINRKLDIFSNMWKDGKISYPVKTSMARLATALHHRKCDMADKIHLSLMMDYVSEVGLWMVGIKRLIQEAQHVDAPLSPTDNTTSCIFSTTHNSSLTNGPHTHADHISPSHIPDNMDDMQIMKEVQLTENSNELVIPTSECSGYRQSDSPATIETTMID